MIRLARTSPGRIAALAVVLSAVVAPPTAAGSASRAHTDTSTAHDCLPSHGETLVATEGGLIVIDASGRSRARWTSLDGLPATRTSALAIDGRGSTWVGTESGLAEIAIVGDQLTIARTVASKPVRAIASLGSKLYAGTWGGGVIEVRGGRARPISAAGKRNAARDRITALAVHGGVVWVGTAGAGVHRIERNRMVPVKLGMDSAWVWSLTSIDGALWIGTMEGLFEHAGDRAVLVAHADVRDVALVDGHVVAAVFGDGVYQVRAGRLLRPANLPNDASLAYAIAERDGAACIAGHDGVWVRADATAKLARATLADGPPSNDISALAADGDRLWVGTFDRGLAYIESGRWRLVNDARIDARVNALAIDGSGALWIATAAGLAIVRDGKATRLGARDGLPSRNVLSLCALADGGMLVGTTRGAVALHAGRTEPLGTKQGLRLGNVWAVRQDADGAIWLGTTRGLYRGRLDDPDGFVRFSVATGHLDDDWVMALETRGRTVWAGTYKGGVVRFEWTEGSPFDAVTVNRLGGGSINPGGLTWVDGTLYASTMDGVATSDGTTPTWRRQAGATGRDTTAVAHAGGKLWIASRRGLAELN